MGCYLLRKFCYTWDVERRKFMNQEKIGKFISERRKSKNITQRELAEKLGVTDKTVSRWENGHYLPDISLFESICSILEIDISELLKGKCIANINEDDVKDVTSNLIKISNDKIKKKNKKIVIIAGIIISILMICSYSIIEKVKKDSTKTYDDLAPNMAVHFPSKMAVIEKDDGWVARFNIEYNDKNSKTPYLYDYGCHNLKYKALKDYTAHGVEEDNSGKYEYEVETNHPNCIYNKDYNDDISAISKYFIEKKFNTSIKTEDLDELQLKKVDKKELLELYNKAITSELVTEYGNYSKYPQANLKKNISMDGYTWYLGYLLNKGKIVYVNLELQIGEEYLSDKIKNNKATEEEKNIFLNIEEIEKYIIKTQKFSLIEKFYDERPYNFLPFLFSQVSDDEIQFQ